MKLLITIVLALILICTQSAFVEKGDLTNKMTRTSFPDFVSSKTQNLGEHDENIFMYDLTQYNSDGDFAVIFYQDEDQAVFLIFYDIKGVKKAEYTFGGMVNDFNEGDLGVSITSTNQKDEVFVAITLERELENVEIVGAIIGVDGKFRRSESWITLLSSEDYNFSRPQVLKCEHYIYVVAYTNDQSYSEFQGDSNDDWTRRILTSPATEAKSRMGYPAFNYIDISGKLNLLPPTDLEGTRIEFFDAEQTSRVYLDLYSGLNIKHLGGTKASVVFHDKQNIELSNPANDNNQIVYFLIEDAQVSLPYVFDNTIETYPEEEEFIYVLDIISQAVIPQTQNIVLSYGDGDSSPLFISTINTDDQTTVCHKSYSYADTYFSDNFNAFNSQYHPTILVESETKAYISIDFENKQGEYRFYILQFNPSTCEIDTTIVPYEITNNMIQSNNYQRMIFVVNESINQYRIAHLCTEDEDYSLQLSMARFQTMLNCDGTDETNNVCTSCQAGFGLTHDGQCIVPNCGMDCESFDLICDMESLQCLECQNNGHCIDNENGGICLSNVCQSNCQSNVDCAIEGKQCNISTNQCEEITIDENAEQIQLVEQDIIPQVQANDKMSGNLELEFKIQQLPGQILEFLKITMDNKDLFPLNVAINKESIKITLPRDTANGKKTFKVFANKLTPIAPSRRNLAAGYNTEQVYMEKTFDIIDTENQMKIIEEQQSISQQKDQVITTQKQEIEDSGDSNTAYYVLIPIMVVGFIGFAIGGFLLGKKQQQAPLSPAAKQNEDIKTKTEGI